MRYHISHSWLFLSVMATILIFSVACNASQPTTQKHPEMAPETESEPVFPPTLTPTTNATLSPTTPPPALSTKPTGTAADTMDSYPGASKTELPPDIVSFLNIDKSLDVQGYLVTDEIQNIKDWYQKKLSDWLLELEGSFSPRDKPDIVVNVQLYHKSEQGIYIFIIEHMMEETLLGETSGPWELIQRCTAAPGGPPEGNGQSDESGQPANINESFDWSHSQVFHDPVGDFWLGDGSPPQVIDFPPSDIINIYLDNDAQYLYIKFEVNGEIPNLPLAHNNDMVRILSMSLLVDADNNSSTGKAMNYEGADLALEAWFGSPPEANGKLYTFAHYAFYDANYDEGIGEWHNAIMMGGGIGENNVSLKFSMSDIQLMPDSKIGIMAFIEAESDQFHHFARDVLGEEKHWITGIDIK